MVKWIVGILGFNVVREEYVAGCFYLLLCLFVYLVTFFLLPFVYFLGFDLTVLIYFQFSSYHISLDVSPTVFPLRIC